jgi:hypothetical protein
VYCLLHCILKLLVLYISVPSSFRSFVLSFFIYFYFFGIFIRNVSASSRNQVAEDEMGGPCSTNGEKRNACRLLVGKPEGKRPLGRPRRRWVDNIKRDLGEVG